MSCTFTVPNCCTRPSMKKVFPTCKHDIITISVTSHRRKVNVICLLVSLFLWDEPVRAGLPTNSFFPAEAEKIVPPAVKQWFYEQRHQAVDILTVHLWTTPWWYFDMMFSTVDTQEEVLQSWMEKYLKRKLYRLQIILFYYFKQMFSLSLSCEHSQSLWANVLSRCFQVKVWTFFRNELCSSLRFHPQGHSGRIHC